MQRHSTFGSHLRAYCGTGEQKDAKRPTRSFRETSKGRATHPTKSATETIHAISIASSEINRNLHFGQRPRDLQADCVLLQKKPEGADKPIGYWYEYFNAAGRAYLISHKKRLAVI